jgi:hypothetical protein
MALAFFLVMAFPFAFAVPVPISMAGTLVVVIVPIAAITAVTAIPIIIVFTAIAAFPIVVAAVAAFPIVVAAIVAPVFVAGRPAVIGIFVAAVRLFGPLDHRRQVAAGLGPPRLGRLFAFGGAGQGFAGAGFRAGRGRPGGGFPGIVGAGGGGYLAYLPGFAGLGYLGGGVEIDSQQAEHQKEEKLLHNDERWNEKINVLFMLSAHRGKMVTKRDRGCVKNMNYRVGGLRIRLVGPKVNLAEISRSHSEIPERLLFFHATFKT